MASSVEQKAALVSSQASLDFEELLRERERARPGAGFHGDSPEQGENMQRDK